MEPEDLPWPGELEEEEDKEEEREDEVVVVEELAGKMSPADPDLSDEFQRRDSTDEEDEEAEAWLQAPPTQVLTSWDRYSEGKRSCVKTKMESWHCLPREIDFSQTSDTLQNRLNMRERKAEVKDFPSLEEGALPQSEGQVKRNNRDYLCSPLLVIQDSFASPDLPLLTCLTRDQEFGTDSLFQQSEVEFAPLRGVPDSSEDCEWFSRPSEVSEALFQAASEATSLSSCFSVSQHPLVDASTVASQHSLSHPQLDNSDELKPPQGSTAYDVLCSYMSLKTQEMGQQVPTEMAGNNQGSFSYSSDTSDENVVPKGSDNFDASCLYMQCWKQKAPRPSGSCKGSDSLSDSSDTVDEKEIPERSNTFDIPAASFKPWREQRPPQHLDAGLASTGHVSSSSEAASHLNNKMLNSFLNCLLERRNEEIPLASESHYFESTYVRIPVESEVQKKMDPVEGQERIEVGLGEGLPQRSEQQETGNKLASSGVHPRSLEIQLYGNVVVPGSSVKGSEAPLLPKGCDPAKVHVPAAVLQAASAESHLGSLPEQLYVWEARSQKESTTFAGQNVDAAENVAFKAIIASIEPSKKESRVTQVQTDPSKSLVCDGQGEPKNADLTLSDYSEENFLLGGLSHPLYQSTPGVCEPASPKPVLQRREIDISSLYDSAPPEPAPPLCSGEKSHEQLSGLDRAQVAFLQGTVSEESTGKRKSISDHDLVNKTEPSHPAAPKMTASESLLLQGLKQHSSEEDTSSRVLAHLQESTDSDSTVEDATEHSVIDGHAVVSSERVAELLREVDHSSVDFNKSFSSALTPYAPHKSTRELEFHPPDLRMLRVFPEAVSKTLRRLAAWNLKFNLTHGCGHSISELNDDDRRKVEEIKAKLFGHEKTVDMSQGLQSPQGVECRPEAVCSHIIIESHEKGCIRTLMTQQNQLEGHPCVCRLDKPQVVLRGQQSSPPWRDAPCDLSRSLDQSHPHFRVWNSLQLRSHSPLQNFTASNFKISKDPQVPFRGKVDPWLSETVEPVCVSPEGMDLHSQPRLPPEPMKKFTTSITFSSHRHTKCVSDSSVFKVGVTEGGTTASVGVFKSHFTEEHHPLRAQNQRTSSPSAFKMCSHSPGEDLAVLAETWQNHKFPLGFERFHQEVADCRADHCDASHTAHFSSATRLRSPRGAKEKPAALPPDVPSLIFLEQRELLEQSKAPCASYRARKPSSPPPQHQDHLAPCLTSPVFLEQRELLEQSKASNTDEQIRADPSSSPHGQDCITVDLPSDIFLEQRKLFEQSQAAYVDTDSSPSPQDQECLAEKGRQRKPVPHVSDALNIDDKFSNVVSQAAPRPCSPPSNRKAVSCVRITLSPKAPCKADSGTLDKRCTSPGPVSSSRTGEYGSELHTATSRSSDPTSEPKSSLDSQAFHFPGEGGKDLKVIPQHRQTQVNKSDLEGSFHPTGMPVSADRPHSVQKVSSDAVTQITTEGSEKTSFTSEIFINAKDRSNKIPGSYPRWPFKTPVILTSVEQKMTTRGTQAEPSLLPYKPSGSTQMYYVPELRKTPPPESKSDTTLESSHSGSNDAIAPIFPAQVLGTRDDDLPGTVNIKHKEGIYSKRAVTKPPWSVGEKPSQRDTAGPNNAIVVRKKDDDLTDTGIKHKEELSSERAVTRATWPVEEQQPSHKDTAVQVTLIGDESLSDTKVKEDPREKVLLAVPTSVEEADSAGCITENLPDVEAFKQREEILNRKRAPRTAWTEETKSLHEDAAESSCHAGLENTTHSVFQSAQFYIHHPVHLPSDADICQESLEKGVFMRKNSFPHHPDKELSCLPPSRQNADKTKVDYTRIESLRINVNLGNKEKGSDYLKSNQQGTDLRREAATHGPRTLNTLWNKYQERQRQQKPPEDSGRKDLSLVERLDRLARLLQNPITHSLQVSESTPEDSREEHRGKAWGRRQQKLKHQTKKRCKDLEKHPQSTGDSKRSSVLPTPYTAKPNQIKFEHIKFNKYMVRKQPGPHYVSNTSSDSRPSEESELLTDTTANIFSTTTSPMDSECLTQTDREVALNERSSSISTIDTARLIQAFGRERVCVSPRRIRLYSASTSPQKQRLLEKRCRHSQKATKTGHFHVTTEHTRRRNIQMEEHVISSDSVSSTTSSFWSSTLTPYSKPSVHMSNKGVQAGNLEIVNGVRKHTRDVGVTFPTPSSSEVRLEGESDVSSSLSEEKSEAKSFPATYHLDRKLKTTKSDLYEGISWFVPVENVKHGPRKENVPRFYGPGVSWFEPITNTKPWREPLQEKNWQEHCRGCLGDHCKGECVHPLKPFVRANLQEALHLHRPDFIFRSGERLKRLKLIVQERKLQRVLQSERDALFRDWQGCGDHTGPQHRQGALAAKKNRLIGKKEMIQRSKRIYEQLPEVRKKKEEEKRRSEYKSYRLRAQLYKKKVANRVLGRKVPWD